MTEVVVRQYTRRKPEKKPDPFQSEIDRLLAMRRGELTDRPVSKAAHVLKSLAKFIGVEISP